MIHPYRSVSVDGRIVKEHIAVAEKALGKHLPSGAIVHHVDHDGRNNVNSNLVICPSQAYHKLLHLREAALLATGDPDKRPCHICKQYDDPSAFYYWRKSRWHRACANILRKERKARNG